MADEEIIREAHRRLPFLAQAPRFCCFARLWWGGAGFDAIAWWETDGAFRLKTMRTAEVRERTEAQVRRNDEISQRTFELAAADFLRANLVGLSDYPALSHFGCLYGLKEDRNRNAQWFFDGGGHHPGLMELQNRLRQRVSGII